MKLISLLILLTPISLFAKELTGNLGTGGTKLFDNNLSKTLLYNPTATPKQLSLSIDLDLAISDSLYKLSKEDSKIIPGTYQSRLSPYYGQENRAEGIGGVSLGYKGLLISPLLYLAEGEAILNNPAYPNAAALIHMGQGWGIGYSNQKGKFSYGLSRSQFTVNTIESNADVLNYQAGIIQHDQSYRATYWNLALGYQINFGQLVGSYIMNDLQFLPSSQLNLGWKSPTQYHLTSIVEIHNLNQGLSNWENQIHIGLNYNVLKYFNLELGLNQLYPTYGIKFKSKFLQLYYEQGSSNQYGIYRNKYDETKVGLSLGWNLN